ncbi:MULTISPECIES: ABC-F family ATP-binding cassette domain-containing protein [unclassified Streptococcus]|uniref:ABC-F family ATP-binding cassette domain-containing protein n=1 Tax=unclassified Streptococcus TaxID=2608887 RepID=UPI001071B0E4|nr:MULTISPECIES: ABC-F family ATP-binding cassette domain-containing protein [unclassified Streptococcus]MBF0805404.1 ABC-F family ATP-binding cassette domain-containing protein [Streptococcus sp. 19428wA2_WM07]TFU29118.1 ABC-F family ATP-binding cassette domain-containing protein [Streptococcus sp. WM07]
MIIMQASKVERSFAGDVLFQNITFQIGDRDRIALVGRNGAGKSTLLKILVGVEEATSGEISRKKDLSLSYLSQSSSLDSNLSIYDEMLKVFDNLRQDDQTLRELEAEMGQVTGAELASLMSRYDQLSESFRQAGGFQYEAKIRSILNGFQFDEGMWSMPISDLSGGQKTRLALAKMLLEEPQLLVLDEPTNHLDIETIAWLENYLTNYQGALLIVSHDRYFLDKVANITWDLRPNSLDRYVGNYTKFVQEKAQRLETQRKEYEKQQKEIAALEDFVAKNLVRASTTKRAQSRRKKLEKMDRLEKPGGQEKAATIAFPIERPSGNVVLTVEEAAIGYEGQVLSQPISLDLRKYTAIAVVGPNGVGKTTFLKSLKGDLPFIQGQARLGTNVDFGYYDQNQETLSARNTVLDELWNDFPQSPELEIRNRLGSFLFSGDDVQKTIGMLSGGERSRLLLAKLSMEKNNFLVLDEPTNHLDIESKEALEQALIDFEGTLLFVSHDRYFINRIADQVLELSPEGSRLFLGDYDYYLEKKKELEELAQETEPELVVTKESNNLSYEEQKESQKEIRRRQRRIEELERQLEELSRIQTEIQASMLASNDPDQLIQLQAELEQAQAEEEVALEEWAELEE